MKFKIGDKVKIRRDRDSEYAYQHDEIGNIIYYDEVLWYDVEFEHGYRNSYQESDLELVGAIKKEIKQYGIVGFLKSIERN